MAETSDHETFVPTNPRLLFSTWAADLGRLRLCCIAVAVELTGKKANHMDIEDCMDQRVRHLHITCSLSWFSDTYVQSS